MNNTTSSIITIGREYGSAGRQIGQEVARYFGIKCYDKELLEHAANDSGICKELFENHDERPTNSFLYSRPMVIIELVVLFISATPFCNSFVTVHFVTGIHRNFVRLLYTTSG